MGNFVKNFYLPYHFPTETYVPHSKSRNPPVVANANICGCFRSIENGDGDICVECIDSLEIINCAMDGEIPEYIHILFHIF